MEKSKLHAGAASPFPKAGPSTARAALRPIRMRWSTVARSCRSVPIANEAGTKATVSPLWWTSCAVFSAARIGAPSRRPLRFARKFRSAASATASAISLVLCKSTASSTAILSSARLTTTSASFAPPNLHLALTGPSCPAILNAKQKTGAAQMASRWFCRSSKSCAISPRKPAFPSSRNWQGWSTSERFARLAANRSVENLNRVHHGGLLSPSRQCRLHLQNTPGISRRHHIGFERSNELSLAVPQRISCIRLHEVEDSRRAAADSGFRNFRKLQPGNARKQCARLQTNALRMLQVTRIVKRHSKFQRISLSTRLHLRQDFAHVLALRRKRPGPFRIFRLIP